MSYSQEVYDAVRSRISGGDVGQAVRDVAFQAFDISFDKQIVRDALCAAAWEMQRPSVLHRPEISADGTSWCALLGDNLQVGVSGFGDTPAEAMAAFDEAFWKGRTPTAIRLASAMSCRQGQDPQGLGAQPASAVGNAETPNPNQGSPS
jgi:hypothetical protein